MMKNNYQHYQFDEGILRSLSIGKKQIIRSACLLLSVALGQSAEAQTATSSFQVLINIEKSCTVISATTMNFGTHQGVIAAPINQTSQITVQCTDTTPYTVGLDAGTTPLATVTARQMANGAARVNYALYSDPARTANWGNSTGSWVSGTGTGAQQILTVYGQVPVQNATVTGPYSDTITVTVTY